MIIDFFFCSFLRFIIIRKELLYLNNETDLMKVKMIKKDCSIKEKRFSELFNKFGNFQNVINHALGSVDQ